MQDIQTVSLDEAASRLSISRAGVYRLIKAEHLKPVRIFQRQVIPLSQIAEFIESRGTPIGKKEAA